MTTQTTIEQQVGAHHYFNTSVFDARDKVQGACPEGWRAGVKVGSDHMPAGAIIVGDVKVRHGDPAYALYVYPVSR